MYISRLEISPRNRKHPEPPAPPLEVEEEPFDDDLPVGRGPGSDPPPEPPLAWDYDARHAGASPQR